MGTGCIVEKNMEQVCNELGLSMSAAFTVFAKKVGREKESLLALPLIRSILRAICVIWNKKWQIINQGKLNLRNTNY